MSETPPPDSEVEEGSPFGGPECEESSPEPAQLVGTEIEEPNENLYPIANLAVEFYEGPDDPGAKNVVDNSVLEPQVEISPDSGQAFNIENTEEINAVNSNNAAVNSDQELDREETYNESYTSGLESLESHYKELQKTSYIEDFIYSNALSNDESSNSNFNYDDGKDEIKGSPLARFPKIVKSIEYSDYETLQVLYQLLYQRSAWDTQEILSHRILEFSGFTFGQNSEDYFNREMMLRTLPNEVLIKIGAILGLDQVQKMLADIDKGRPDLIQAILHFLSRPSKKARSLRTDDDNKPGIPQSSPSKCGCRSRCFKRFTPQEQMVILDYQVTLEENNIQDSYLIQMIELRKIIRKPGTYEDSKKLKEVYYRYKVRYGAKEAVVCKGAFCSLYGLKQAKINQLQNKLKTGKNLPPKMELHDFPPMPIVNEPPDKAPRPCTPRKRNRPCPKSAKKWISSEEQVRRMEQQISEDEIKSNIEKQKVVPKVVVEKFDINSLGDMKNQKIEETKKTEPKEIVDKALEIKPEFTETENVNVKLKDFPLVVKAIENAPEELLIDVHFLLFLTSADVEKVKENILEFSGFTFDADTEEYDERNEFLQRMSFKIVSDVARSFSLGVLSTKEDTIKNTLAFLTKPNESFLRVNATLPLSLSDVELDDLGDLSDSDVSITCEVVEKNVECIDLISSGEDSDKETRSKDKTATPKKSSNLPTKLISPSVMKSSPTSTSTSQSVAPASVPTSQDSQPSSSSGVVRTLRNFETICKIVNTHPHEYLVDIFELLYLKKHEPSTLRSDILDFSGFTFEKGSQEYVKRKQLLDRMLYNSVRRIYNTLIHNTTEVKVFSKPTMIAEIFQFLFKLPDQDTSVRPPPSAKPITKPPFMQGCPVVKNASGSGVTPPSGLTLPSQTGKLSDLKRVFQRVACFPCEYLIDVHKLLFMTDCDQKVIRQNIFAFKGFSFSPESQEFQQRKMYLEYLTFHSLRKISSVLTTRSVDLRNSTKHELATHLTQVLAEYCNASGDGEMPQPSSTASSSASVAAPTPTTAAAVSTTPSKLSNSEVENIVVTPIIDPSITGSSSTEPSALTATVSSTQNYTSKPTSNLQASLPISISNPRSVSSPAVTTTTTKKQRKRKSTTVSKLIKDKELKQVEAQSQFADINLPEVDQYRQLYGQNLNIYPTNGPAIAGIATFNTNGIQPFPQMVPQTVSFPVAYSQVPTPYPPVQPSNQIIGINQSLAPNMVTQVPSNQSESITSGERLSTESDEPALKRAKTMALNEKITNKKSTEENSSFHNKIRDAVSTEEDEDCDKPLSSLVGHPIDTVLKKQIADIVEQSDLQSITINGVIQKVFNVYPKFDLSYRKEFIKSTLRSILYRLGQEKSSESKDDKRDADSPDCPVTTTENCDSVANESSETSLECS